MNIKGSDPKRRVVVNIISLFEKNSFFLRMTALIMTLAILTGRIVYAETQSTTDYRVSTDRLEGWPTAPEISAWTATVMDQSTNMVLYDKGSYELERPIGMTMLMAMLLVLENMDPSQEITFSEQAAQRGADNSHALAVHAGETLTVLDCLYAMSMHSAEDAALQLALEISGSEASFVDMMNEKALEIGCTNTHYSSLIVNDSNQYTCIHDLAMIVCAGLHNETYAQVLSSQDYTIPANSYSGQRQYHTDSPLLDQSSSMYYQGMTGAKTAQTGSDDVSFLSIASRGDMTLVCIVMGETSYDTASADTTALLDYGFDNFTRSSYDQGSVLLPQGIGTDMIRSRQDANNKNVTLYYYGEHLTGRSDIIAPTPTPESADEDLPPVEEIDRSKYEVITLEEMLDIKPQLLAAGLMMMLNLLALLLFLLYKKRRAAQKRHSKKRRKK